MDITAALQAIELQTATSFGDLIRDDPLAVIVADRVFHRFRCWDSRCHIRQLLSVSELSLQADFFPATKGIPSDIQALSEILAGNPQGPL